MPETVEIAEYATSPPVPLTQVDLALLQSIPRERLLAVPTTQSGWFTFRSSSYVGTVELGTVRIRINPKVDDLRNVLMMFAAAAGMADWSVSTSDYASDDLVEGVAELVLRTIDEATRRGLIHGYQTREERLTTLRGRVLVDELAARPWDQWPAPCRYDDFTADVSENRVLLAAVVALRRWALAPQVRRLAAELEARFDEVTPTDVPLLEVELIRNSPLNEHYQPALVIACLLLEGLGPSHAEGSLDAVSFLIDMNRLFEAWISAELSERLWPDVQVREQEGVALSKGPSVRMNPDLLFGAPGTVSLVGDVKYKLTSSGLARNADYYQLLAYATATNVDLGILIYCQAEEAPAKTITIEHGGQRLICHPLPLSGDWRQVSLQVDLLASKIRALTKQGAETIQSRSLPGTSA